MAGLIGTVLGIVVGVKFAIWYKKHLKGGAEDKRKAEASKETKTEKEAINSSEKLE